MQRSRTGTLHIGASIIGTDDPLRSKELRNGTHWQGIRAVVPQGGPSDRQDWQAAMTLRGSALTDHDIIDACSTSRIRSYEDAGRRLYIATFEDGSQRVFAVNAAEFARIYAVEYGLRISGGRVVDCRWMR